MSFLAQWFWYLVAFAVGAALAWAVAASQISARSESEAVADLEGARQVGGAR